MCLDSKNFECSSKPSKNSTFSELYALLNVALLTNSIISGRKTLTSSTNIKDCNLWKKVRSVSFFKKCLAL